MKIIVINIMDNKDNVIIIIIIWTIRQPASQVDSPAQPNGPRDDQPIAQQTL